MGSWLPGTWAMRGRPEDGDVSLAPDGVVISRLKGYLPSLDEIAVADAVEPVGGYSIAIQCLCSVFAGCSASDRSMMRQQSGRGERLSAKSLAQRHS